MKRSFTVLVSSLLLSFTLYGQGKNSTYFKMPTDLDPTEYSSEAVLVKVKSQFRDVLRQNRNSKIAATGATSITPLFPTKLVNNAKARRGPRKTLSGIDLSDYYQIQINPSEGIEKSINQLYSTGYFEIVEPAYRYKQAYTPNDPSTSSQYYLSRIGALNAWNISKSDESVVIAIIDSGVDITHPDLAPKLFVNENEIAGNGIDDDDNGYVDDVTGWDFSGAQSSLIGTPGFTGDNNPAIIKGGTHSHGTMVGGCAAAATDNGVGIAGVGFNARLLFTKHYADDQASDDRFYTSNLYLGILYAATVLSENAIDRKIINCSFGGSGRSQVIQDFINLVTLDYKCLVIAAAGNDNQEDMSYPAAYTNVLSVGSTDSNDRKSSFSNFGAWVDISTPGSTIFTTTFGGQYENTNGTSFSCPITSGAAALVWTKFPELSPQQVAEKLRVTSEETFYTSNSNSFAGKLGKGRLNVFNALTKDFPSLRASNIKLQNQTGSSAVRPGQTGTLFFDISNILASTSPSVEISVTSNSSSLTFTTNKIFPGAIMQNSTTSLKNNPFTFNIAANVAVNRSVDLTISYSDGDYRDFQIITVNLNPSYIDLEENQLSTTIGSKGRIGYDGEGQKNGLGFQFNGSPLLYEMGIVSGGSSSSILNNVRGSGSSYDQDFVELNAIDQIIPGLRSSNEVFGSISNSATVASQKIQISYRTLAWQESPNDKFIIMEYTVTNPTASTIDNYYFGLYADWDIATGDGTGWNAGNKIGYTFPKTNKSLPTAGIQVLTGNALTYGIDNNQDTDGVPFGVYDGFTDEEKFTALSSLRAQAGIAEDGGDVSHMVSSGPYALDPNETIVIAFAIHAADNLEALLESAQAANTLYNLTLKATVPTVEDVKICYGNPAEITATGATAFKWYRDFTGGEPFYTGATFTTGVLTNDTTFYISNAENDYESVRATAAIILAAKPDVVVSGLLAICEGNSLTLTAAEADEYIWSSGENTRAIEVTEAGTYSVTLRDLALECESNSDEIITTILPTPSVDFTFSGSALTGDPVTFTSATTDGVSFLWNFGDGETSIEENPVYRYKESNTYDVTLQITSINGCATTVTKTLDIITGLEDELSSTLLVYPNPANEKLIVEFETQSSAKFDIEIISIQGQKIYSRDAQASNGKLSHTIATDGLSAGMYLVRISDGVNYSFRKVFKTNK